MTRNEHRLDLAERLQLVLRWATPNKNNLYTVHFTRSDWKLIIKALEDAAK